MITPGNALRLKARQELQDKDGVPRFTGEEWMVREIGAYLPGVLEEVMCVCVSVHPGHCYHVKVQGVYLCMSFVCV